VVAEWFVGQGLPDLTAFSGFNVSMQWEDNERFKKING
jgi:hypothetical protein